MSTLTPQPVSDVLLAFPADLNGLLPPRDTLPDPYQHPFNRSTDKRANEYIEIVESWFNNGLPATVEFHLASGVDGELMMRHVQAILGSFQPKHEHKIGGVAYLLSEWTTKITGWKKP